MKTVDSEALAKDLASQPRVLDPVVLSLTSRLLYARFDFDCVPVRVLYENPRGGSPRLTVRGIDDERSTEVARMFSTTHKRHM